MDSQSLLLLLLTVQIILASLHHCRVFIYYLHSLHSRNYVVVCAKKLLNH